MSLDALNAPAGWCLGAHQPAGERRGHGFGQTRSSRALLLLTSAATKVHGNMQQSPTFCNVFRVQTTN